LQETLEELQTGVCGVDQALSIISEGEPMRCSKCGSDNPEDKRFCGDCGSPLARPQLKMTPQLQQAIKILKLSLPELGALVRQSLARTKR
jgi:hypothetical protein